MSRVSKLRLPPLDWGEDPICRRVASIRKERGFTQVELAARIGAVQTLVAGYATGRLRLAAASNTARRV
jgi:transcriptional regulator with XRE-family HTH domain